jgi:Na+-transporting NADH:ubiquinone oxidoreductase subunit C
MNKRSNLYIFVYSSAMVILVAALLAIASTVLKPFQQRNIETEKRLDILKSVGKATDVATASNKHSYVGNEYKKYIIQQLVINSNGDLVEGTDAFRIDLKAEMAKPMDDRKLPLFVAQLDESTTKFIIPLIGRGLWGPIWGYISLSDDYNTIYGASFAHKAETPGLGAEISTPIFQEQFKGKMIFSNGKFVSVKVLKGGVGKTNVHGVDAVSGGTITSKGLEDMIKDCLEGYQSFFVKNMKIEAESYEQ